MKVVVFGGSGFLGSHTADVLTEQGHDVTIFDGRPSRYLKPNQQMVVGDVLDESAVSGVLKGSECVYHFAGMADLDDAATRPLETVKQNILGTATVLDMAVRMDVKRFVYASTIYVYSNRGGFYRCSKQAAELYVEEYARRFGLGYTVLRFGTIYGPRAGSRNSIWRYLRQGLAEGKIVFAGTGEEVREYIHVRDAAELSVKVLSDEFRNQHVIITGHQTTKAREMLNMIREILNNKVTIEFISPSDTNHYTNTPYSFSPKIGRKLARNFYVDMEQGLLECLQDVSQDIQDINGHP